jgi:fatty acyl-CoA reductase
MVAGAATGILRTMMVKREKLADLIPVDIAINIMCVAAWKLGTGKKIPKAIPIYNCTSGSVNPITWGQIEEWALNSIRKYPVDTAMWYPGGSFKTMVAYDRVCRYAFHYAPAYLVDAVMTLLRKRPFLCTIVHRMTKAIEALEFFATNQWSWTSNNVKQLKADMPSNDLGVFDFDLKPLDWQVFIDAYVLGTRHYVLKNSPDTLDSSRKKQRILHILHLFVQFIFCLVIYYLFMSTI